LLQTKGGLTTPSVATNESKDSLKITLGLYLFCPSMCAVMVYNSDSSGHPVPGNERWWSCTDDWKRRTNGTSRSLSNRSLWSNETVLDIQV